MITLRPMTPPDVDALMPHEKQMFGSEAWSRRSYLEELADQENRCYLVAVESAETETETETATAAAATPGSGRLLGAGGLLILADTAQILTVGVLPDARRRGIGRQLVRGLVAEAVRRNAVEVLLEVRQDNDAARNLYLAEGFSNMGVRRGYYDRGRVDAVTMRLALTTAAPAGSP